MNTLIMLTTGRPAHDWNSWWPGSAGAMPMEPGQPWRAAMAASTAPGDSLQCEWRDIALMHRGADSLAAILEQENAHLLVLMEPAAVGLAIALSMSSLEDAQGWLADWRRQGEQALELAMRHSGRSLLVDAAAAETDPVSFGHLCRARLARVPDLSASMQLPITPEPLCLALAKGLTGDDAGLRALEDELRVACTPLRDDAFEVLSTAWATLDARAAVSGLHAMRAAASQARDWALRAEQAEHHMLTAQQQCMRFAEVEEDRKAQAELASSLQSELSRTAELYRAALAAGRSLRQEAESLGDELLACQVAQRELSQRCMEQADELQASARRSLPVPPLLANEAQAKLTRDLQSKILKLTLQREAATLECEQRGVELRAKALESGALRDDRSSLRRELARMEGQLLQRGADANRLAESLELAGGTRFTVAGVSTAAEHAEAPHLGLTLRLDHVQAGQRRLPEVVVRLVEHHGHPGIALFATVPQERLLLDWRTSGAEAGAEYVLLIPTDDNSRPALDAMGSTDWDILASLTAVIERWLMSSKGQRHPRWLHICRRLREHLLRMSERLRFDAVDVDVGSASATAVWHLRGVQWRWRRLNALSLRLSGPADARTLELFLDDIGDAPLAHWPADESGAWLRTHKLSLRPADVVTRGPWQEMDAGDREFLLALLARWTDIQAAAVERLPLLADLAAPSMDGAIDAIRRATVVTTPDLGSRILAGIARRVR